MSTSLSGLVDPEVRVEPPWLEAAVDVDGTVENDPQRIRASVAAMSLLVHATSISRPWVPLLVPIPFEFHHTVGEPIGDSFEIRLSVDTGRGSIAEEAAECSSLAAVTMPEREVERAGIAWIDTALLPHVDPTETGGDLELDANGNASYGYEPIIESDDDHCNGTANTAVVPVTATIKRDEIDDVMDLVEPLITGSGRGIAAPWSSPNRRG